MPGYDDLPFYDRAGSRISMDEWARLTGDAEYCRIASDYVGPYWISTVWLGLDANLGRFGAPLVFETMVFARAERDDPESDGLTDFDCQRWATEEQARAGHAEMVTLVRATLQEDPPTVERGVDGAVPPRP